MKNLTKKELQDKIIKYFGKKNILITINDSDELVWIYKQHYSEFKVRLYLEKKSYSDKEPNLIRYYISERIKGIGRRKTSINNGFCLKIYKDLMWIKPQFEKMAEEVKSKVDTKTKYCTELELHYKKIYKNVNITTTKYENTISININCSNNYENAIYYSITYKDNRYYLNSKIETFNKPIETIIE